MLNTVFYRGQESLPNELSKYHYCGQSKKCRVKNTHWSYDKNCTENMFKPGVNEQNPRGAQLDCCKILFPVAKWTIEKNCLFFSFCSELIILSDPVPIFDISNHYISFLGCFMLSFLSDLKHMRINQKIRIKRLHLY